MKVLPRILFFAALFGLTIGCMATPDDEKSNQDIEKLIPASVFDQKEFPKPYVVNMMRTCLKNGRVNSDAAFRAGKSDDYCSCLMQKRIKVFTLSEFIESSNAHWDAKTVPAAARKNSELIAQCLQSTLK